MKTYKDKQLLEDIYDLIKVCALSDNQADSYAIMSRQHAYDAKKNLRKYLKQKNIEWNGEQNTITIGKGIVIQLTVKGPTT